MRGDVDLTGEGTPEVIVTYTTPDEGGVLLIDGCIDGRYLTRYQAALGGATPQLLNVGDMNFNQIPEVLFTSQDCTRASCSFRTQIVTWDPDAGALSTCSAGRSPATKRRRLRTSTTIRSANSSSASTSRATPKPDRSARATPSTIGTASTTSSRSRS